MVTSCDLGLPDNTTAHGRALWAAIMEVHKRQITIKLGDAIHEKIEPIIKAYLSTFLSDTATIDKIAELQANGWEYGTHPRKKAEIVLQAIKEMVN